MLCLFNFFFIHSVWEKRNIFFFFLDSHWKILECLTSIMYSIFNNFRNKQQQKIVIIHEHLVEFLHLTCLQICCVSGANMSDVTKEIAAEVIFSSSQICLIAPSCVYCLQPYPPVANLECCSSCTQCDTKLLHAGPRQCTLSRRICVFTSCGGRI